VAQYRPARDRLGTGRDKSQAAYFVPFRRSPLVEDIVNVLIEIGFRQMRRNRNIIRLAFDAPCPWIQCQPLPVGPNDFEYFSAVDIKFHGLSSFARESDYKPSNSSLHFRVNGCSMQLTILYLIDDQNTAVFECD